MRAWRSARGALRGARARLVLFAVLCGPVAASVRGEEVEALFDRVEDALTFATSGGAVRARVSGTLDLEAFVFPHPAPWVFETDANTLWSPRLTTFVDAQLGPATYAFAQVRIDRGFDPGRRSGQVRLDEYALRWSWPRAHGAFQVGKFATVVGNWAARHGSWTNAFITAPLVYENLTGMWDTEAVRTSTILLQWSHVRPGLPAAVTAREKTLRIPIIWGPSYSVGAAWSGRIERVEYALEVKQAALSSRPEAWHRRRGAWDYPTLGGRIGFRSGPAWNAGVSASHGMYLRPFAAATLPAGRTLGDYRQTVVAADVSYAHRHVQWWAEVFGARFAIPGVGDADTLAYYIEARRKLTPRTSLALRWNQQVFATIAHRGGQVAWGHEAWRVDFGPAVRFTPHVQMKFQYSLQRGDAESRRFSHVGATQLTVRF